MFGLILKGQLESVLSAANTSLDKVIELASTNLAETITDSTNGIKSCEEEISKATAKKNVFKLTLKKAENTTKALKALVG